ncbi:hypothetical protein ABTE26_19490, partial [Acinetobacter baumannii]
MRFEFMRLGNLIDRVQKFSLVDKLEGLFGAIRTSRANLNVGGRPTMHAVLGRQPEAWRHVFFEDIDTQHAVTGIDPLGLVVIVMMMAMRRLLGLLPSSV